jgi:hypothetical protein
MDKLAQLQHLSLVSKVATGARSEPLPTEPSTTRPQTSRFSSTNIPAASRAAPLACMPTYSSSQPHAASPSRALGPDALPLPAPQS